MDKQNEINANTVLCMQQILPLFDLLPAVPPHSEGDIQMLEEMPYRSLIVEGIKYFYSRTDRVIPQDMLRSGLNWAGGDIENFVKAADRIFYRDVPTNTGIFLDIGGNIGTTSIYCKMK